MADTRTVCLVQSSRYLGAAGIVALLYDHLLSFPDEVEYIWKARWAAPKVLFLILRYFVPAGIILHTYQLSGISEVSLSFCKRWFETAALLCIITTGPLHFLVMLWLWVLWQRNRYLMFGTFTLFFLTQLAIIALAITAIAVVTPSLTLQPLDDNGIHGLCSLSERGLFPTIFIPGMIFETMSFVTASCNALNRPRARNTELLEYFYKDGIMYILVIFLMNAANLIATLWAPLPVIFLCVCFLWCATTITVTRLILKLRKLAYQRRQAEGFSCPPLPDY